MKKNNLKMTQMMLLSIAISTLFVSLAFSSAMADPIPISSPADGSNNSSSEELCKCTLVRICLTRWPGQTICFWSKICTCEDDPGDSGICSSCIGSAEV